VSLKATTKAALGIKAKITRIEVPFWPLFAYGRTNSRRRNFRQQGLNIPRRPVCLTDPAANLAAGTDIGARDVGFLL
jgi:hypothetical protein